MPGMEIYLEQYLLSLDEKPEGKELVKPINELTEKEFEDFFKDIPF